jgi:hypothetical protein
MGKGRAGARSSRSPPAPGAHLIAVLPRVGDLGDPRLVALDVGGRFGAGIHREGQPEGKGGGGAHDENDLEHPAPLVRRHVCQAPDAQLGVRTAEERAGEAAHEPEGSK